MHQVGRELDDVGKARALRLQRRADVGEGLGALGVEVGRGGAVLGGADLSREELSVRVVPQLEDEFTCSECFLVHHRSSLAYIDDVTGQPVCTDCAG